MAILKKTITGLKPNSNYLFTLKPKNSEIAAIDEYPEAIRIKTPVAQTTMSNITGLVIAANFQSVMIRFDPVSDIDLDYYEYRLYSTADGSGSILYPKNAANLTPVETISGTNKANIFTVAVDNSTTTSTTTITSPTLYSVRVRTVSTSGVRGTWSSVSNSSQTPLIAASYIQDLNADKITAGTIGAHEIVLTQPGSQTSYTAPNGMAVLRSSNYSAGSAGWLVRGDGLAEFNDLTVRSRLDIGGDDATSFHVDSDGNMWLGAGTSNFSTAPFKVSNDGDFRAGSADKYIYFDGTNITFTGNLSGAGGTFTGALSGGTIQIGSGESVFKADSNGIYLGNETFSSAEFRVTPAGSLTATSGSVAGWSLSGSQITAGTVVADDSYGQYITLNSSASLVAYRKDFNSGFGEYWTKVDVNSGNPGVTVTGNSNGYNNTSAIRSSNISTRLFIHNEYTSGAGYGKFTATGSHVYFGDGAGSYTMRIVNSADLYGQGTGGASTLDVLVNSNGTLVAPSSSIRFKENVNNLNVDYKKILSIQPVSFFYKDDSEVPEGSQRAVEYGVIAEQVEEAGVPELVNYKDGVPFSVPYSKMPVFLLEVCRKQQELIEDLESRINLLESK